MIVGNDARSAAAAGVRSRPNVVRSTSNGICALSDAVPVASVPGESAIVCPSAFGSRLIAANVVAASANNRTLVCATGATADTNTFTSLKNRVNPDDGFARYRATGSKCPSNAGNPAIVSFNAEPRPANTSPAPTRLR